MKQLLIRIATLLAITLLVPGFLTRDVDTTLDPSPIPMRLFVDRIVGAMSIEEKVGQLFIIDLRRTGVTAVRELSEEISEQLVRFRPGGVLLFGENIETVEQTRTLVGELQRASEIPLFIATDYEGGLVSRLTSSGKIPATRIPPSGEIGARGDLDLAFRIGKVMGSELAALGITMNFAPVADVLTNPASMIGNRAFSSDPQLTAAMVASMVTGIQESGVSSVVKHFPGHGNISGDSHDGLVELSGGMERLRSVELPPFAGAIGAGVDGVMTAHIVVPELSGTGIPTTFSAALITGVLREELGYDGLVITDSLTMRAIRTKWGSGEAAVLALEAGADIILHPLDLPGAVAGVLAAVASGELSEARIDESVRRIVETKRRRGWDVPLPADPYAILGNEAHRAVIRELEGEAP